MSDSISLSSDMSGHINPPQIIRRTESASLPAVAWRQETAFTSPGARGRRPDTLLVKYKSTEGQAYHTRTITESTPSSSIGISQDSVSENTQGNSNVPQRNGRWTDLIGDRVQPQEHIQNDNMLQAEPLPAVNPEAAHATFSVSADTILVGDQFHGQGPEWPPDEIEGQLVVADRSAITLAVLDGVCPTSVDTSDGHLYTAHGPYDKVAMWLSGVL